MNPRLSVGAILIFLGITLLLAPQVVSAQYWRPGPTYITICNSGNTTLSVARITNAGFWGKTTGDPDWVADGWWRVEPGHTRCIRLDRASAKLPKSGMIPQYVPGLSVGPGGYYYLAFMMTGRNGTGTVRIKPKSGSDSPGFERDQGDFENVDRKFCVDISQDFERQAKLTSFEDPGRCPSGWVQVPFSKGINVPWSGGRYRLTIITDSSLNVALVAPPQTSNERTVTGRGLPGSRSAGVPLYASASKRVGIYWGIADDYCVQPPDYQIAIRLGGGRDDPACAKLIKFMNQGIGYYRSDGSSAPAVGERVYLMKCVYEVEAGDFRFYTMWYHRVPENLASYAVHGREPFPGMEPVAVTECPADSNEAEDISHFGGPHEWPHQY